MCSKFVNYFGFDNQHKLGWGSCAIYQILKNIFLFDE